MKILAIGAHPDDIELGCAGTLLYLRQQRNAEITLLILTEADRLEEQKMSNKVLGVRHFERAGFRDTEIPKRKAILFIEKIISETDYDVIFTHAPEDTHQDHRVTAAATISACRNRGNILFYESYSTESFQPTVLVDITETYERKCEAVLTHESQASRLPLLGFIKMRAENHAHRLPIQYAEGFMPRKFIWKL